MENSIIIVKQLKKSYQDLQVLNGIDLEIKKGEVVVLIGPSGCGKSTLLRCMNLLEEPTEGQIIFEGAELTNQQSKLDEQRQKMMMVFQQFNLFPHMKILENLSLGPMKLQKKSKEEAKEKALSLLERVGLADKAIQYPQQLSGGQKQRAAICRALAMEPDVILFDEPTSALDPISTSKIEDLAVELKKDYTIVMVTHNMQQAARISDKTAFFLLGEVVEYGETEQIFSMPKDKRTEDYITGRFG